MILTPHLSKSIQYSLFYGASKVKSSGVARASPGGRLAHPEGQNEEENKSSLRKNT